MNKSVAFLIVTFLAVLQLLLWITDAHAERIVSTREEKCIGRDVSAATPRHT